MAKLPPNRKNARSMFPPKPAVAASNRPAGAPSSMPKKAPPAAPADGARAARRPTNPLVQRSRGY